MSIKTIESFSKRNKADVLILPFFEGNVPAFAIQELSVLLESPLKSGDFSGKKEEVLCHYPSEGKEQRIVLVGLGQEKQLTKEVLRRSFGAAILALKGKAGAANIVIPQGKTRDKDSDSKAVAEGALLANYVFDDQKSEKDKFISTFIFIGGDSNTIERTETICQSVCFVRDLVMTSADIVTPTYLGKMAQELESQYPTIKTTVLGRKEISQEKLSLLEAVSRAASEEPAFITIQYSGAPESKEITALIGKGVTFDTGGLILKPKGSIEGMRDDMSGAGAVLGTIRAVAALQLPVNVVGVISATENAIGPKSYKPGDVYQSYQGMTVEINDTDAEGRLVLADALAYAQKKFAPQRMIDIATLTGGAIIALGEEVSAIMSNDDALSDALIEAGESTYERLWRLPLYEEYNQLLKSKIADIKNSSVRKATPIQGGMFLKKFIKKGSWAHLDIAGTAFPDSLKPYQPVQATGVGVRLLTEFFENLCKS